MGSVNAGLTLSVVEEARELYQMDYISPEDKFFSGLALLVFTSNTVLFLTAALF